MGKQEQNISNYVDSLKTKESVESYKKMVNEICDNRLQYLDVVIRAAELSERPFGYIKEAFEAVSSQLFKSKEGRQLIKKYTKTIKENEDLRNLHSIYENIRKTPKGSDVSFLVNGILEENINVDKKALKQSVNNLGLVLAEAYMNLGTSCDASLPVYNKEFDDAVTYVYENKKSIKNLSSFNSALSVIKEEIDKHEDVKNEFKKKDIDEIANTLMKEFNEKYNDQLSDDEKKAIKELFENTNKKEVFEKYKGICLDKLSEAKEGFKKDGDEASFDRISTIYEQVAKKVFSEETIEKDICNLVEITNVF